MIRQFACSQTADFTRAQLNGADLRGADLRCVVGLEPEQIKLAITDETTKLPAYLKRRLNKERTAERRDGPPNAKAAI